MAAQDREVELLVGAERWRHGRFLVILKLLGIRKVIVKVGVVVGGLGDALAGMTTVGVVVIVVIVVLSAGLAACHHAGYLNSERERG